MNEMWPSFLAALADPNQPEATLDALQRLFRERVGAKLFTVTSYDAKTRARVDADFHVPLPSWPGTARPSTGVPWP